MSAPEALAVRLVEQLRRAGIDRPVTRTGSLQQLDSRLENVKRIGKTYFSSTFVPTSEDGLVSEFLARFCRRNWTKSRGDGVRSSVDHEQSAAFGYVAIMLLKQAIERTRTVSPSKVAKALRLFVESDGVLGRTRFAANGDLLGLSISFNPVDPSESPRIVPFSTPGGAFDDPRDLLQPRH